MKLNVYFCNFMYVLCLLSMYEYVECEYERIEYALYQTSNKNCVNCKPNEKERKFTMEKWKH